MNDYSFLDSVPEGLKKRWETINLQNGQRLDQIRDKYENVFFLTRITMTFCVVALVIVVCLAIFGLMTLSIFVGSSIVIGTIFTMAITYPGMIHEKFHNEAEILESFKKCYESEIDSHHNPTHIWSARH